MAVEVETKLKKGQQHFIKFKGSQYAIDRVVLHKGWRKDPRHDMALLHLSQEVKGAKYAALYTDSDEKGKLIYIVGNAAIGNGKDGLLPKTDWKYRAATNRIDEVNTYFVKFVFDSPDSPSENLTHLEGVSGSGDSGGPAFVVENGKTILLGVGSTQSTKKTNGIEGVYGVVEQYMRVSKYVDWIKANMKPQVQDASTENAPITRAACINDRGKKSNWGLIGVLDLLGMPGVKCKNKNLTGTNLRKLAAPLWAIKVRLPLKAYQGANLCLSLFSVH